MASKGILPLTRFEDVAQEESPSWRQPATSICKHVGAGDMKFLGGGLAAEAPGVRAVKSDHSTRLGRSVERKPTVSQTCSGV